MLPIPEIKEPKKLGLQPIERAVEEPESDLKVK